MGKTHIDLIILSPSAEVNKLTFPAISTATTIGELREKIADTAVIHPPPTRQRLIYRGHALIDANKTLKEIFTQEIIDSSDTLSLHLVLPPETATQPSRSSTPSSASVQGQRSRTPQHMHGSPDIGANAASAQQVNSPANPAQVPGQSNGHSLPSHPPPPPPPQTQHGHGHHHPHIHMHGGFTPGPFPPQLQQAFAQFHAVNAQLAAQLAAIGNNPALHGVQTNQAQGQPYQQPVYTFNPPQYPNIIPQQQQARAAGAQPGIRSFPQQTASSSTPPLASQGGVSTAQDRVPSTSPPVPANSNTPVRENQGPNGERWQMIVQSGPVNMTPMGFGSTRPNQGNTQPSSAIRDHIGHNVGLIQLQSNLSAIEAALAGGNPLSEPVFDQARAMLSAIPEIQEDAQLLARRRIDTLAERANQLRRSLHDNFVREAHERAAAQRETQGTNSSAVYVLSSPSGPQALLVSPSGLYTTPWQFPLLGAVAPHPLINQPPPSAIQTLPALQNNTTNRQQPQVDAAQIAHPHRQGAQEDGPAPGVQVQQQQANQVRDLLRILLPLGGHLWLMIRLFGFVYFFTAGAGWRRTILLGLIAMLVFIAQTGIFRPIVIAIWDPIRRHAEGLVPLAGNERPNAGAAAGAPDNTNARGTQPANRAPTAQEAAERLLRERERQDGNFVRHSIRRVERAIALFVASLVPGVGERHIAAREAAEAARQAEARGREERARREEEEARQRAEGAAPENSSGEENSRRAGANVQSSAVAGQGQAAQPPLVEI